MGLIQFMKDVGRRLALGDTTPAQSAQAPVARPVQPRRKQPNSCGWSRSRHITAMLPNTPKFLRLSGRRSEPRRDLFGADSPHPSINAEWASRDRLSMRSVSRTWRTT